MQKLKVGLYGIGLDTYWPQFEGLYNRLLGYQHRIKEKMETFEITVVDAGLIDNPQKAIEAGDYLRSQ